MTRFHPDCLDYLAFIVQMHLLATIPKEQEKMSKKAEARYGRLQRWLSPLYPFKNTAIWQHFPRVFTQNLKCKKVKHPKINISGSPGFIWTVLISPEFSWILLEPPRLSGIFLTK